MDHYQQSSHMLPITHLTQQQPHPTQQSLSSKKQIAHRLTSSLISSIEGQIMDSKITISEHSSTPLQLTSKIEAQQLQLNQIIRQREELRGEMARLREAEQRVKDHQRTSRIDRKSKSEHTKEQQQTILELLKSGRQVEQLNYLKTAKMHESIRAQQLAEYAHHREKKEQRRLSKQAQAMDNLKRLEERQEERAREINRLNKAYHSVKGLPVLHVKMEQEWVAKEAKGQSARQDFLSQRKKGKALSMKSILDHEHQYRQLVEQSARQIKEKYSQLRQERRIIQQSILNQHSPSKFLRAIMQEDQRLEQLQLQKSQLLQQLISNKHRYGEGIRQAHKEHLKKKLPPIEEPKEDYHRKERALSREQLAQLGNRYLREVHSSVGEISASRSAEQTKQLFAPEKYRDYLKELKKQRQQKEGNPEVRETRELETLLKKEMEDSTKLYLAKVIAGKLDQRTRGNQASLLLASINAKMAIIENFTQ